MEPGHIEVTGSHSENIGLPQWSFVNILVSVKFSVEMIQFEPAQEYASQVAHFVVQQEAEKVARALNMWGQIASPTAAPGVRDSIVPQGLQYQWAECVFSMTETIGMPNKSSVKVMQSSKMLSAFANELDTFDWLAWNVAKKLNEKRDLVKADPRPWTIVGA